MPITSPRTFLTAAATAFALGAVGAGTLKAEARRGKTVVARGTGKAKKAGKARITLRFTKAGKRKLRGVKKAALKTTVTFTGKGGAKRTTTLTVSLAR